MSVINLQIKLEEGWLCYVLPRLQINVQSRSSSIRCVE